MRTTRRWSVIAFLAVAAVMATLFGAASATATPATGYSNPTLAASPASGAVGSSTTVTGDLWTPGQTVNLTFNSTDPTPVGSATVSANGTFSVQITVPQGKEVGAHTIVGTDAKGETASTAFQVTGGSDAGGVTVTDPTPAPGQSITVTGKSCTPGTTVTVSLDGTTVLGTGTADSSGAYSIVVKIPAGTSTGSHQIQVSGAGAGCSGVLGITVTAGGNNGGGLASTGVAVIGIGALGVVLLVGGGLMLLAGRRRRTGTLV